MNFFEFLDQKNIHRYIFFLQKRTQFFRYLIIGESKESISSGFPMLNWGPRISIEYLKLSLGWTVHSLTVMLLRKDLFDRIFCSGRDSDMKRPISAVVNRTRMSPIMPLLIADRKFSAKLHSSAHFLICPPERASGLRIFLRRNPPPSNSPITRAKGKNGGEQRRT